MNNRLRCFCQLGDLAGDAGFLAATRQHIHQHPELSFKEADTAALVARHLDDWGWAVTRGESCAELPRVWDSAATI